MSATVFSARVWEVATVTGTGSIALTGTAQPGYLPFSGNIASGSQVFYCAYDPKAQAWETGFGTYTAGSGSTGTLTRGLQQSSTGALINFAGNTVNITNDIPPPVQQSVGAASAGKVLALNTVGLVDNTALPVGIANGVAQLDASGNASALNVLASGGTTARSLAAMAADYQNVLNYGVVADGTTVNNTALFNFTSTAAAAGVNAIIAPSGSYYVSSGESIANPPGLISFGSIWPSLMPNYFGNTDGSFCGYNVAGVSKFGHAFGVFRSLQDSVNQSVVTVQGIAAQQSGTNGYEKIGLYVKVIQDDTSLPATGIPTYNKDLVGIQSTANVGSGLARGRVWAATFGVTCPTGADGDLCGLEIDVTNNGTTPNGVANNPYKTGMSIVSMGLNDCGSAIVLGGQSSRFQIGYNSYVGAIRNFVFVHSTDNTNTNQLSYLDSAGAALFGGIPGSQSLAFAGTYVGAGYVGLGSNFLNNPGTGPGGFSWFQLTSSGTQTTTGFGSGEIARLDATGSFAVNTSLIAQSFISWGNNNAVIPATISGGQGGFVGWNNHSSNAETDFVNYRPANIGSGGHAWYDYQVGSSAVLLAQLLGNGNLLLTGTLQINKSIAGVTSLASSSSTGNYMFGTNLSNGGGEFNLVVNSNSLAGGGKVYQTNSSGVISATPLWKWNSSGQISATGGFADGSFILETPASGATIQVPDFVSSVQIENSATLAALTIDFPPNPSLGQTLTIGFLNPVTALTLGGNFGINWSATSIPAGGDAIMYQFGPNTAWERRRFF